MEGNALGTNLPPRVDIQQMVVVLGEHVVFT
jgi:hypothetical protein